MEKLHLSFIVMLLFFESANAQLKVNSNGLVSIDAAPSDTVAKLTVGSNASLGSAYMGVASRTVSKTGKNNIALLGIATPNENGSTSPNYGVLGVSNLNCNNGRNYGVSGMISFSSSCTNKGGAGIYGTSYTYFYSNPDNLQGLYAAYFNGSTNLHGTTIAQEIYNSADERFIENAESLGGRVDNKTLISLLKMDVLEYKFKNSLERIAPDDFDQLTRDEKESYEVMRKDEENRCSRLHFGLSAQKLQKIYPNLVLEGQDGYLYVNYTEMVPLLIRSIQELKQELDELKGSDGSIKKMPQGSSVGSFGMNGKSVLYQNTPNPFKEKTVIRFTLGDDVKDASICIFDMSGKLLKKLLVSQGMESVSVNGYELGEGMFLYSLVVNGQEIDTKRLILSK